jgi:hypothetical protein
MAHPNEELVRRGYEAFATGDMETLRELLDPEIVWHSRAAVCWPATTAAPTRSSGRSRALSGSRAGGAGCILGEHAGSALGRLPVPGAM